MFFEHNGKRSRVVLILDNSKFFVRKSLFRLHNAWICTQFDHPHSFGSSVHIALNNTETVLFFVCFGFLMCTHTEGECCMMHCSSHCGHVSWIHRYLWIMRDFACTFITEQRILVKGTLCSNAQKTPKPYCSPYFSLSCCMRRRLRSLTWWPKAHETNRCTF